MKKRIRFVWLLAGITVIGIILFQVYWVYNSYKTEKRNFYKSVTISLQNSVTAYMVKEVKFPARFIVETPFETIVNRSGKASGLPKDTSGQLSQIRFKPLPISQANSSQMNAITAMIVAKHFGKPLKKAMLTSILQDELRKNNLPASFKLILLKKQKKLPENRAAAFVSFSEGNNVIIADIMNVDQYLLLQILGPALVSLLLIFLSVASLYYMGFIIRRQMKLDTMKNDFFNNIAHELRTPISILKSTHEALYNFGESSDPEITSRYLQINMTILDKLDSNVDRILDITRYEHGLKPINIEKVDLRMLVNEVVAQFQLNDQVSIQSNLPTKSHIGTDKYIVLTVLTNLLDNAVKYAEQKVNIQIIVRSGDHHWELEVKDNGQGISEQHLPYIFDKFYRVPSGDIHDVKGYGLGLSYVKELVKTLNGEISVKSKLGIGTTFTVKFPNYGQN